MQGRDMVAIHFLPKLQQAERYVATGKFIYNPLISDIKQLLSNMINHKATQVFGKVFHLNYPTILD